MDVIVIDDPKFLPRGLHPEIERLREASAVGNLAEVEAILSKLLAKPAHEKFEVDRFVVALSDAVENNHVSVASYI